MKAIVIGCGKMGQAIIYDMVKYGLYNEIHIVDKYLSSIETAKENILKLCHDINCKLIGLVADISIPFGLSELDKHIESNGPFSVLVSSADYSLNIELTRLAIRHKINMCDLGGNNDVVKAQLSMTDGAKNAGIVIIPDCGLAPGMACFLAAYGIEQYKLHLNDYPLKVQIRVGGLPQNPKPPLNYKLVFSAKGLINEYIEPCTVLYNYKIKTVDPLTDIETNSFYIDEDMENYTNSLYIYKDGKEYEAFNTSGGLSTLAETYQDKIKFLNYKTIRYTGHCQIFAGMKQLGLFDNSETRTIIEKHIEESLSNNDKDVVIVKIIITGFKEDEMIMRTYNIYDKYNDATNHSAMARTTGYPTGIIASMLSSGEIMRHTKSGGVFPGEIALPLESFVNKLIERGFVIKEELSYNLNTIREGLLNVSSYNESNKGGETS